MLARYSEIGERVAGSSVVSLTISAANRLGSLGLLRERVMHSNIAHHQPMSSDFWGDLLMNWIYKACIFVASKVKRATHDTPIERGPKGTTQLRGENGVFASKRNDPPKEAVNRDK